MADTEQWKCNCRGKATQEGSAYVQAAVHTLPAALPQKDGCMVITIGGRKIFQNALLDSDSLSLLL